MEIATPPVFSGLTMKVFRNAAFGIAAIFLAANLHAGVIYLNNGDAPEEFQAVDTVTGQILYSGTNRGSDSPIAVRDTIWLGDNGNVNMAIEYNKATGAPTGNTRPLVGPYLGTFRDGAASASSNFTLADLGFGPTDTAAIYITDLDWTNPVLLFSVTGPGDFVGITYDMASANLWISDSTNIYQYSLSGSLISTFAHVGGYGSLAYEGETDSLWYVPNDADAPLLQYSKNGDLLRDLATPTRSANIQAAEFAVVPEPSTCALFLAASALVFSMTRGARSTMAGQSREEDAASLPGHTRTTQRSSLRRRQLS